MIEEQIKGKPWRAAFVRFSRPVDARMAMQARQGETIDLSDIKSYQDPYTFDLSPDLAPYLLDPELADQNTQSESENGIKVNLKVEKEKKWWDFEAKEKEKLRYQFVLKPMEH